MGLMTSQQISRYYDLYRNKEVIISKEIAKMINLDLRQVSVKCLDAQWPCIINSASLAQARIIIGINSGAYGYLVKEKGNASLRFHFVQGKGEVISFFVASKVTNIAPYGGSTDLVLVTLQFTQRPPDDLIAILGEFIEANVNFINRKDERIILSPDIKRKLGLFKDETVIHIQGVPRQCILRDVSFGGARIILLGIKKFLLGKEILLRLEFEDVVSFCDLSGVIADVEEVQDRRDISVASIQFLEKTVPMVYKQRINSYITTLKRPQPFASTAQAAPKPAASAATPQTAATAPTAAQQAAAAPAAPQSAPPAASAANAQQGAPSAP